MTRKNLIKFAFQIIFTLALSFTGAIFSQTSNSNASQNLSLEISSKYKTFNSGPNPIIVNIQLKNISTSKIRLWRKVDFIRGDFVRGGFNLEIIKDNVKDSLSENYELSVRYKRLPRRCDVKSLAPNRTWKIKRDINQWAVFSTTGTYRFRAILITENWKPLKIKAIPPVYSNWIVVKVLDDLKN